MRRILLIVSIALIPFFAVRGDLPRPLGWVSDYAGLLDRDSIQRLNDVISAVKASVGVEIAVVTRSSLDEFGSLEETGLAYLEGWGVGQKGKDNGLVILIVYDPSTDYKGYKIETGYGLEGELPDGLLGQIAREEMVPYFKQGEFGKGVLAAVVRIGNVLGADLGAAAPSKTRRTGGGLGWILFLFLMMILLAGRRGRGSGLLALLLLGGLGGPRRSGGFGGGGFGGGGFGGFGGGSGGGGGVSGSW